MALTKTHRRSRIRKRVRKVVSGTAERPRLAVYRSNKDIYAQIIDDRAGKTLCAASSRDKELKDAKGTKAERATEVGKVLAERAAKAGVTTCAFDRSGYLYHGRVKSLAEGARKGGLKF